MSRKVVVYTNDFSKVKQYQVDQLSLNKDELMEFMGVYMEENFVELISKQTRDGQNVLGLMKKLHQEMKTLDIKQTIKHPIYITLYDQMAIVESDYVIAKYQLFDIVEAKDVTDNVLNGVFDLDLNIDDAF